MEKAISPLFVVAPDPADSKDEPESNRHQMGDRVGIVCGEKLIDELFDLAPVAPPSFTLQLELVPLVGQLRFAVFVLVARFVSFEGAEFIRDQVIVPIDERRRTGAWAGRLHRKTEGKRQIDVADSLVAVLEVVIPDW